jgi:hypothetical protein
MASQTNRSKPRLEKIVSTKISSEDFRLLTIKTKELYNQNAIALPAISHLLRWLIAGWCSEQRNKQLRNLAARIPKV